MALSFAALSTDLVNCGSSSVLDNVNTGTIIVRFRATSFSVGNAGSLFTKGNISYSNYKLLDLFEAGAIVLNINRATTDLVMRSADALISINTDYFLAVVYNTGGVNTDQKIYLGTGVNIATEIGSYVTQQVGTGAVSSDAADNCVLGNFDTGATFQGGGNRIISSVDWFNTVLSLNAIQRQQYQRFPVSGCIGMWDLGWPGTTVIDRSGNGNNGTVTGAAAGNHQPVIMPFATRRYALPYVNVPSPVYLKRGKMFFGI